jgi:hypothetical protein
VHFHPGFPLVSLSKPEWKSESNEGEDCQVSVSTFGIRYLHSASEAELKSWFSSLTKGHWHKEERETYLGVVML